MNSKKIKIYDFAKEQYLQVDTDGKRINTWQDISNLILKKFGVKLHLSTIQKWCKKDNWENLFERFKMAGIENAQATVQEKENKLIDEKSGIISEIYKTNKQFQNMAKNILMARMTNQKVKVNDQEIEPKVTNKDLLRLLSHAENILINLQKNSGDAESTKRKTIDDLFPPDSFFLEKK